MGASTGHSSGLTALIGRVLKITAGAAILAGTVVTTPVDGSQGDVDVPFGVNGLAVMRGGNQPASLGVHLALSDTGVIAMAGSAGNLDDSAVTLNPSGGIASVLSDELGRVVDVATTADDRTVVASNRSVHRWMPDGSPDTAFGAGGEVNLSSGRCACWIVGIDVDASGRVVVIGERGISQLVIVRLLENGQLDRSFAADGINEEIPFGLGFYGAMAVAPDGAIVLQATAVQTSLVAVNADGTLRSGFGIGGVLALSESVPRLIGTDDGRLYVVQTIATSSGFRVRKLRDATGATDSSWGSGGVATIVTDNPSGTMVHGVPRFDSADARDTVITVGYSTGTGTTEWGAYLTAFDTDTLVRPAGFGATDPAGPGIVTVLSANSSISVATVISSADGLVVVARLHIQRRNNDGTLRTTFGNGGQQTLTLPRHVTTYEGTVVRDPDGDLLSSISTSDDYEHIIRHSSAGTLRSSWGQNGRFSIDGHFVRDHDPLADGRLAVLVYDRANSVNELLILSASGVLDTTLGAEGHIPVVGDRIDVAGTVSDPQIIATTFASTSLTFRAYDPDTGAIVPSYGAGGAATVTVPTVYSQPAAAVAPDGSLWWAVSPLSGAALVEVGRMLPTGQPDGSFGSSGRTAVPPVGMGGQLPQIHFDGGLAYVSLVVSAGATYGMVARVTGDGRLDPTYGGGVGITPPLEGFPSVLRGQENGRVTFLTSIAGMDEMRLARLDATGAPDETLGYGGITTLAPTTPPIYGRSMVVDANGVIVLGTVPTAYPGELPGRDAALARFRTDGASRVGQPKMVAPRRLLHTSGPTSDGLNGFTGPLVPGAPRVLPVGYRVAVPGGPSTVILNVTTMQSSSNGYLTVGPCDETPSGATVTFTNDGPVSNEVIVPLTWSPPHIGAVCIWTSATTQAVIDVVGGHPLGTSYRSLATTRYWDTRPGSTTFDGAYQGTGRLTPTAARLPIPIGGRGYLPPNAEAAVLNVTAIRPASNGYLTVGLCDQPAPTAATVTYQSLRTISNEVVMALPTSGRGSGQICVFTSAATDVTVDVVGWFEGSSALNSWVPRRAVNSLAGGVTDDGLESGEGRLAAGVQRSMRIAGRAGVPPEGGLVVMNITAVRPVANGYLVAHPCDEPVPPTASLVFGRRTVSSEVLVRVPPASQMPDGLCVTASTNLDVIIDVSGSFPA